MSSSSPPKSLDSLESPSFYSPHRLQHSFPQNERFPRQDFSNRYRPRRGSTASVASSIGGTLDTATHNTVGPLQDLTQNAIATLLSPPIVRTGLLPQGAPGPSAAHRPPSIRDIPPVTLTTIPHVDPATFKTYLAQIGYLYDAYQRAKAAQEESGSHLSRQEKDSTEGDYFSQLLGRKLRSDSISSKISQPPTPSGELSPPASSPVKRPASLGGARQGVYAPTPLSTIPTVYFDDNFQLENPRIFDVVSEFAEVSPAPLPESRDKSTATNGSLKQPSTGRRALHTNAILQEKLSWYMDTVEVHLISSIATASTSFFAALGSLKELQSEAADSTTRIRSLRAALLSLDTEMATGGLEIVKMRRRRENMHKLGAAVSQLGEVMEEARKCEALVDKGDLEGADGRIEGLEKIIIGPPSTLGSEDHNPQRIDLRQLKALDGISEGIDQLRFRIGRGFETRFIEALLRDLRQHVESVPPEDTMQRWAKTSLRLRGENNRPKSELPAYLKTNENLRPDLLAALAGLSKTSHTARAATAYREAVMREIKTLIRRNLPSSNDDDAESVTSVSTRGDRRLNQQEKSAILARNLRTLDPDAAEELLVKVYTSVGEALRRLGLQTKVLLDVTSSIEQPFNDRAVKSPPRNLVIGSIDGRMTQDSGTNGNLIQDMTQALDLSSLLGQAVDVVQNQITKILKVRGEQNARLPLQQFLRYFTLNRLFADECEAVSSRSGDTLKDVINYQVKEFLNVMSESERQHINQVLEADRWEAKDFGPAEVTVLERILESMNSTPKAWIGYTQLWNEPMAMNVANGTGSNGNTLLNGDNNTTTPSAQDKPQLRLATIDTQPFILTTSSIDLLHGLDAFLNLIAAMPFLTSEAGPRLLDYLKTFNSRCCQLILGAGATKSAGLKNITTKHLALASQACSFIVALVPYMREFVRRQGERGVSGPLLAEFDRVKRMVQEHQGSIHEKLVDIMTQRSHAHVTAMRKVDWDAGGGDAEVELAISAYVEVLTKETGTLHRVLSRHVSEIDLRMIMIPIFKQYSQEWTMAFREAVVRTEKGKARMLRDVEYLESKFSKIEGGGDFGKELLNLVNEKQVAAISGAQPTATDDSKPTSTVVPTARSSVEIMGVVRASVENQEKLP